MPGPKSPEVIRDILVSAIESGAKVDVRTAGAYGKIVALFSDPKVASALETGQLKLVGSTPEAVAAMHAVPAPNSNVVLYAKKGDAPTETDIPAAEQAEDWKLTNLPESRPGLYRIDLDRRFLGSEKDSSRIDTARQYVHEANLLGKNPLEDSPNALGQGLELYVDLFPNKDEREENRLIVERLGNKEMRRGEKGCFDVILGRDSHGHVIAYHQFSTIPLQGDNGAVGFMQYTGNSDDEFMRKEHGEAFGHRGHGIYTMNIALMQQVGDENAREHLNRPGGFKGYFLESEYKGQGETDEDIRYTETRLKVHGQTGAKAIMLKMKDGTMISPHYQPSLGEGAEAIKLLLLYRRAKYDAGKLNEVEEISKEEAERLLMAFIGNFDTEGFDASDVDEGRQLMKKWFAEAESAVLVPPAQLPDVVEMAKQDPLLKELTERDYGDLDEQAKKIKAALEFVPEAAEKQKGA